MGSDNSALVYRFKDNLYVNLTNDCPTSCVFCMKQKWKMNFRGYNLALSREYSWTEFARAIEKESLKKSFREIVFCGYGEPTMHFGKLMEISRAVRNSSIEKVKPDIKIRLDTNGMGNIINRVSLPPKLRGLVNSVFISLNTANEQQWLRIMNPRAEYRKKGFESVLKFTKECVEHLDETVVTAIDTVEIDVEEVSNLAKNLGAGFLLRPKI